jgi:large subunit ribosomal protein L5e
MVFVKEQLTKAYFKRFQVKFRRRRDGKTDYFQRKRLVKQDKNKYASPKYRLVVRVTNRFVICQIVYSTVTGDKVMASAYSSELARYGLSVGLKNYPAAYCTGLLVGRRVLKKLGMDDKYTGVGNDEEDEVTGEIMSTEFNKRTYFVDELNEDRRPLRVYLDIGLARTSLGARIFGALKGASDAGLDVPHNPKKFPGYDPDEKQYDAEMHKAQIFGEAVSEYMRYLQDEDEESGTHRFEEQFAVYHKAGVGPDDLEDLYASVHKNIRANPSPAHAESGKVRKAAATFDKTYKNTVRLSKQERDAKVEAKKEALGWNDEE